MTRDWLVHAAQRTYDALDTTWRDLSHRTQGLLAEARASSIAEIVSDDTLVERIRAAMGHTVRHASAIEVRAEHGRVTLRGPILARDLERLFRRVAAVRGVRAIDNQLEACASRRDLPVAHRRSETTSLQGHWSPTARLLAGLTGAWMMSWPLRRRPAVGAVTTVAGAALLVRAATNESLSYLLGVGLGPRGIEFRETIQIAAPTEQVFGLWQDLEQLPRYLSHVRRVQPLAERRSHWTVAGPTGVSIDWDAELTDVVPNERIAWKTLAGSAVQHTGVIRFEPVADGTRLHIQLSYTPITGTLGHLVAWLFGEDPQRQMHEDLVRFKTSLETGQPPRAPARGHNRH